jgi:hypothetical protein
MTARTVQILQHKHVQPGEPSQRLLSTLDASSFDQVSMSAALYKTCTEPQGWHVEPHWCAHIQSCLVEYFRTQRAAHIDDDDDGWRSSEPCHFIWVHGRLPSAWLSWLRILGMTSLEVCWSIDNLHAPMSSPQVVTLNFNHRCCEMPLADQPEV